MEPLISVIVPVYKVEAYLNKCVQSIVDQTYTNLEIILVDDGSPDECPKLCDEWAAKDERIKVIHQENRGISMARNSGLDVFEGEYLMFVDSDDYLSLDAIEVLYKRIESDGSDMVFGDAQCVDETGMILSGIYATVVDFVKDQDAILNELGGENCVPCYAWGKLYRRRVFEKLRFKGKYAEDVWALPDVLLECQTISSVAKVIYYYCQRSTSLIHTLTDDKIICSIEASLYTAQRLCEKGKHEAAIAFYISALHQAVNLNNIQPAKKIICAELPIWNKKLLIKYDIHTILRYLALYLPLLHWTLRERNRSNKRKEGVLCRK